jgi:hypothetical protein
MHPRAMHSAVAAGCRTGCVAYWGLVQELGLLQTFAVCVRKCDVGEAARGAAFWPSIALQTQASWLARCSLPAHSRV